MALALFFIGLVLVVTGVKGTQGQLATLLKSEFSGENNFWAFIVGIFFLGALGYYPPLRGTSRLLIGLTLIVLILSNGGFWQKLTAAIGNPVSAAPAGVDAVPDPVSVKDAATALGLEKSVVTAGAAQDDQDLAGRVAGASDRNSAGEGSSRDKGGTLSLGAGAGLGAMFGDLGQTDFAKSMMDDLGGAITGIASNALGGFGGSIVGGVLGGQNVADAVGGAMSSAANKATGGAFSGTISKAVSSLTSGFKSATTSKSSSKTSGKK